MALPSTAACLCAEPRLYPAIKRAASWAAAKCSSLRVAAWRLGRAPTPDFKGLYIDDHGVIEIT
jgi:hypothetical protein